MKSQRMARLLLSKYRIFIPTLEEIVFIVGEQGYELVDFDPKSNSTRELIANLGMDEGILRQGAFLYTNKDVKLLFVLDSLEAEEKRYAIAHELGHIICGHANTDASLSEEYEANEFVHYFLNPDVREKGKVFFLRHKRSSIAICVVLFMLIAGGIWGWNTLIDMKYSDYYVTSSGMKYHLRDCSLIKDKSNLRRLTEEELLSQIYEPCGSCLGGEIVP